MKERFPEIDALTADFRKKAARLRQSERDELARWIEFSWIHHDNALEGTVTQLEEIRDAIAGATPGDSSLLPVYRVVRSQKAGIDRVREEAGRKQVRLRIGLIRELHALFLEDGVDPKKVPYRRDIPIHRLYFHDIAVPEKIAQRMTRLLAWADSAEFRKHHPIAAAVLFHHKFMEVFPFQAHSGRVGRLLLNLILMHGGYEPVVIHGTDRHRYYEGLREDPADLARIVEDAMDNSLRSWARMVTQRHLLVV